jgi:hypothetical protein
MGDPAGDEIVALCRLADEVLRARGHDPGEWQTDSADRSIARTAVCRRCGLPAHVRAEHGLKGLAGAAVTTPCAPRA